MKPNVHFASRLLYPPWALLALLAFCFSPFGMAQTDSITNTAAEFQHAVYSTHLLSVMADKPELDPSLQVLLELQRRNPQLHPTNLAGLVQQATDRYRTNAPACIRAAGYRDEILAAYLEALRGVPKPTKFVPATLQFLNYFMLQPSDYTNNPTLPSPAVLVNSGNKRLLTVEAALAERQALVAKCMQRSSENPVFGATMDSLLSPVTGVWLTNTIDQILRLNSALSNSPTIQWMLAHQNPTDGSVVLTTGDATNLYRLELDIMHQILATNLDLHLNILQTQTDLPSYLTNTPLIQANVDLENQVKQGQRQRLALANASIQSLSQIVAKQKPDVGKTFGTVGNVTHALGEAFDVLDAGKDLLALSSISGLAGAGLDLIGLLFDLNSAPPDELAPVKSMINDLSTNMNHRFDRVDTTLNKVLSELQRNVNLQNYSLLQVDDVRQNLQQMHSDLHQLERQMFEAFAEQQRQDLKLTMDWALFYEVDNPGTTMSYNTNNYNYFGAEVIFFDYAATLSSSTISSPRDFDPSSLANRLGTNALESNLNYLYQYLTGSGGFNLGSTSIGGNTPFANPREWFRGAYPYLQLALENPMHFRTKGLRVDQILACGTNLTDFFGSLIYSNKTTSINEGLYNALLAQYWARKENFISQVRTTEQNQANLFLEGFPVQTWRNWAVYAPRRTVTTTLQEEAPGVLPGRSFPAGAVAISAGLNHNIALKADGTVTGWGVNDAGRADGTRAGSNVIAIAAGHHHNLVLKDNGEVTGWGENDHGQTSIPSNAQRDVVAIAAGRSHSLALKADGTVLAWGNNSYGQRSIPTFNRPVVAIASGATHNLALKADGWVQGWGANYADEADGGFAGSNVVGIAAGGDHYYIEGTLNYITGFSMALKNNGIVYAWGHESHESFGATTPPSWLTNYQVVAVAAGYHFALALLTDGTVVGWGRNEHGQATGASTGYPYYSSGNFVTNAGERLANVVAIAAGGYEIDDAYHYGHSVALKADGTVVAWGYNGDHQTTVPPELQSYQGPLPTIKSTDLFVLDASSNHLDGRLIKGPTWTSGAPALGSAAGHALSFDGVDDYMTVAPGIWFSNAFTIETWVNVRSFGSWSRILDFGNGNPLDNIMFNLSDSNSGKPAFYIANGTTVQPGVIATTPIQLNQWVHLAATFATNTGILYVNGQPVMTNKNMTPPRAVMRTNNYVGRSNWPNDATATANAIFDDLRIWNKARTQAEILAGMTTPSSGAEPGLVAYWTFDDGAGTSLTELTSGSTKVAAGNDFSLVLRSNGTVVAWGVNNLEQCRVPSRLSGVVDIAAGDGHALALKNDGSVVAWGWNSSHQANVPEEIQYGVVAVAAGSAHSLALLDDGTVRAWGGNNGSQCVVSPDLSNVVAIAAGGLHNLALKHNASVVAWGANNAGQTNVPPGLTNVVAIAAGEQHSLALQDNGMVVAWGWNAFGQTDVPAAALSGVVAIAAHKHHSLALKADGTVVAWGCNWYGQTNLPTGLTNVVAMAAGGRHNVFLTGQPVSSGAGGQELVLAKLPLLITRKWLHDVSNQMDHQITGNLLSEAGPLTGAKALILAVLELGMPYTLERDDVLHGCFYGTEGLLDYNLGQALITNETKRLYITRDVRPLVLKDIADVRFNCFTNRLWARLNDLAASGQPETPRIVGHTLRLLRLLKEASANVPTPVLELQPQHNSLTLYGEPYRHYPVRANADFRVLLTDPTHTILHNDLPIPLNNAPYFFFRLPVDYQLWSTAPAGPRKIFPAP